MPHGVRTSTKDRQEVVMLHIQEGKNARQISEETGIARRTVTDILKSAAVNYDAEQKRLDQPWQPHPSGPDGTLADGISAEDVPLLMDIKRWKGIFYGNAGLSLRIARWVALLRPSVCHFGAWDVYLIAEEYAIRERWAKIEGKYFDTSDLDQIVAFKRDQGAYDAAMAEQQAQKKAG